MEGSLFTKIKDKVEKILEPVKAVPVGSYQYQGKRGDSAPLSIEPACGSPTAMAFSSSNASTVAASQSHSRRNMPIT
jgi:hypothetical protein